uniref:IS200/IS605 family transposase n=1 Tax=Brugia timori TaxID=42155 RepID=A0A0R3R3E0_9BILA
LIVEISKKYNIRNFHAQAEQIYARSIDSFTNSHQITNMHEDKQRYNKL